MREIALLTCLRGLAALWVVLYHIRGHFGTKLEYVFVQKGYLAVDMFFILSGFILTHVYLAQVVGGEFSYRSFLIKRLARIYPVHLVTMIIAIVIIAGGAYAGLTNVVIADQAKALIPHTLLLHSFGLGSRTLVLNYPSWSISAEFFTYLLFSGLLLSCRKIPAALVWSLLLFVGIAVVSPYLFNSSLYQLQSFGLPRIFPEFLLGIALYLAVQGKRAHPAWLLLLPVLVVVPVSLLANDTSFVLGACACIAILYLTDHGVQRPELRPLVHLGAISYSIYMVHALVEMVGFKVLEKAFGTADGAFSLAFLPLVLIATILAGHLCWRFVERPGHRLIVGYGIRKNAPAPV